METRFGVEVHDRFRWLEDASSPDVQRWIDTQSERAESILAGLPEREALRRRLKELLYVEQRGLPTQWGGRYFFWKKPAAAEKAIHFWKPGKQGQEQVLLDPNTMSDDGSLSVGSVIPSHDGRFVVYEEQLNAADESTLRVLEVETGRRLPDRIERVSFSGPSWAVDGSGFYYTWRPSDPGIPEAERTAYAELRFHALGSDAEQDRQVFPATGDASRFIGGAVSHDGTYLIVSVSHGWSSNEVHVKRLGVDQAFTALITGEDALFHVFAYRDTLYVLTNLGAPRFRLYRLKPGRWQRGQWEEIVPEDTQAVLEDVGVVGGRLVLRYSKNVYSSLQIRDLDGKNPRSVPLPTLGTATHIVGQEDADEGYFAFESFTHPPEIHEISVRDASRRKLYYRPELSLNPDEYETRQLWATSRDGTQVPLFVVQRRGLDPAGKANTLLRGYGGFNISVVPQFTASLFPWLERGGVFVSANLRGGGEFGEDWHRAGMLHNKQNVFDDFYAVAKKLFAAGITNPSHLAISGRSNGGLLVGVAMTQHPEMFGAVICGVPLLDMLRYHQLGLGRAWIPEYGDPDVEQDFRVLYAYSPYHHIREGTRYPPFLMASADTDDRVDPMHARKFVAALQAQSGSDQRQVLLRIERQAGHAGADMRMKVVERIADEYAFLLDALNSSK